MLSNKRMIGLFGFIEQQKYLHAMMGLTMPMPYITYAFNSESHWGKNKVGEDWGENQLFYRRTGILCLSKQLLVNVVPLQSLNMEPFEIQLLNSTYHIVPLDNGTFRIMEGEQKIGVVYPEVGDLAIEWKSMDHLDSGFLEQLGELISKHHLGVV